MSKRVEPEISNISLEHDQVKPRQTDQHKNNTLSKNTANNNSSIRSPFSSLQFLIMLIPYITLAGAAWYFHQQQVLVNQQLQGSQQRIEQLENQLSVTGEEMGESTVALRVKLEDISQKTALLLSEVDKLWASAWRKNQKQITALDLSRKKLSNQQTKHSNDIKQQISAIKNLNDKLTTTEFSINAISEQLISLNLMKDQLNKYASQLTTFSINAKRRDDQQILTATRINELETSLQIMLERIDKMEQTLKPRNFQIQ